MSIAVWTASLRGRFQPCRRSGLLARTAFAISTGGREAHCHGSENPRTLDRSGASCRTTRFAATARADGLDTATAGAIRPATGRHRCRRVTHYRQHHPDRHEDEPDEPMMRTKASHAGTARRKLPILPPCLHYTPNRQSGNLRLLTSKLVVMIVTPAEPKSSDDSRKTERFDHIHSRIA